MGEVTKIEWCDATFNPYRGCAKVSPGCANCYAEAMSGRNPGVLGVWGPKGTRVVASEAKWREPLKWDREAKAAGERRRVFCASLADVFEDWQGPMNGPNGRALMECCNCGAWVSEPPGYPLAPAPYGCCPSSDMLPLGINSVRRRLFNLIDATPNLDWLLVTKRPENIERFTPRPVCRFCGQAAVCYGTYEHDTGYACDECCGHGNEDGHCEFLSDDPDEELLAFDKPRPNVWLGTSVEDRKHGLPRIEVLRTIPARVRFLSVEPLLEDLGEIDMTGIDWVIVGGESGHDARPCHIDWIRSLVEQCREAGVPAFVKQLGANAVGDELLIPTGEVKRDRAGNMTHIGYRRAVTDPKGGDIEEFPEDLRIRELPGQG